jgi:hypothetical protein
LEGISVSSRGRRSMDTFTVTALKHGLECKINELPGEGNAVEYATRYHRRVGIPVRVYNQRLELVWSRD